MHVYIVAITPSPESCTLVRHYQDLYPEYNPYLIPPHITLYPPFHIQDSSEETVVHLLGQEIKHLRPHTVHIQDTGYFEGKNNVIYLKPDETSTEWLRGAFNTVAKAIGESVVQAFSDYSMDKDNYRPHITIAEQIPRDKFEAIKKELGTIDPFFFTVQSIDLYRRSPETKQYDKIFEFSLAAHAA